MTHITLPPFPLPIPPAMPERTRAASVPVTGFGEFSQRGKTAEQHGFSSRPGIDHLISQQRGAVVAEMFGDMMGGGE